MCLCLLERVYKRFFVYYNEKMSYVQSRGDGDFAVINLSITNYLHRKIDILFIVPQKYSLQDSLSYDATVGKIVESVGGLTIFHAPNIKYVENVPGNKISLNPLENGKNVNLVIKIPTDTMVESLAIQISNLWKKSEISIDISKLEKKI